MEYILTKKDKKLLKTIEKIVDKWKKHLQLDPLWDIKIELIDDYDGSEMGVAIARVNTKNSEYFVANIEITSDLLHLPYDKFIRTVNEIACHELIHLVMIDFFRTAQLIAGNKENFIKELRYKYEQFTSRLQKSFIDFDKKLEQLKEKKYYKEINKENNNE